MPDLFALFETERFLADVDRIREQRDASWNAVLRAVGLSGSRTSYHHTWNPHIQTIARLAAWAGLSLDAYLRKEQEGGRDDQRTD